MPLSLESTNEEIKLIDAFEIFKNHINKYERLRLNLENQEKMCHKLNSNINFTYQLS